MGWPLDPSELQALQLELAGLRPSPWTPAGPLGIGGCFVCFEPGGSGPGRAGEQAWAAAAVVDRGRLVGEAVVTGEAGAPYSPGLLAAREGPLLESAVRALTVPLDVLVVDATGRDHPRGGGLALHLGWVLDLPTVGVTHRPLLAAGDPPGPGELRSPLWIAGEQVGWWVRTRPGARPVAVTPGWRTGLDSCLNVVAAATGSARTPEPLRQARRIARTARRAGR
jgi:deoxyribonuclease V